MMHPTVDFKNYLKPSIRVHLAGIGGISMCPQRESSGVWVCVCRGSDMTGKRDGEAPAHSGNPRVHWPFRRESAKCPAGDPHSRHPR